jgi:hypothetical protein
MLVAYAVMHSILDIRQKMKNKYGTIALIIVIMGSLAGVLFCTQENYVTRLFNNFPQNKYLVQDDILQIQWILDGEREAGNSEEVPTLACPRMVMVEYQTIDAATEIFTDREIYLNFRDYGYDISTAAQSIQDGYLLSTICEDSAQPDVMQAKAAIIRGKIDYMVVKANAGMEEYMESLDCSLVGQTNSYLVYGVNHNYYETVTDEETINEILAKDGIKIRDITVSLSGETQEASTENTLATYLLLNDEHVLLTADDTTEEFYENIYNRYATWALTSTGTHSADTWQDISAILDSFHADGILMAGDMVDFASDTNYQLFQLGLNKVSTPILYARSDHDISPWYNSDGSYTQEDAQKAQEYLTSGSQSGDGTNHLAQYADLMIWDKGDYYVMAWNNSFSQLTAERLSQAKEIFAEEKPIILVTHVPLNSTLDDGLYEAAKAFDAKNRAKLWGENCLYVPNEVTEEFLEMVMDEESPVCAVLSAHLHFSYETMLNSHLKEYVFAPTFEGNMVRITVTRSSGHFE